MYFPDRPLGGSETQFENVEHLIPDNVNLMLNKFQIDATKYNVHWQHQYHDQPSVQFLRDRNLQNQISAIVFVSYHQKDLFERFLNVAKEKSIVIRNAVWPIEPHEKPKNKVNLIYSSTPFRGLNVLVVALNMLLKRRPDLRKYVHLNVFSNMKLYGSAYENLNSEYEGLYEFCRQHPNITYHGVVPQKDLREHLKQSHIFSYCCTWEESSCIAAIEAMSAGCLPVISNIGALPETCSHYGIYYSPVSTDIYNKGNALLHSEQYSYLLEQTICDYLNEPPIELLSDMVYTTNKYYSWEKRHQEWTDFFNMFRKD
jgi:UDP-glucose:(glucosyl)LPS alpha-1,2-glucosyltransferase